MFMRCFALCLYGATYWLLLFLHACLNILMCACVARVCVCVFPAEWRVIRSYWRKLLTGATGKHVLQTEYLTLQRLWVERERSHLSQAGVCL